MLSVSVLLPTRDRPEWLPRAVASVMEQTHPGWQLVVLDNGLPIRHLLPDDDRILYRREPAAGMADALNRALKHATGDLVTTLADDDRLAPEALATYADRIGDADWIVAGTLIEDEEGRPLHYRGGTPENVARTAQGDYMLGCAVCWRRVMHDRCGVWDATFAHALDVDLFARFLAVSYPAVVADVLHIYTDHPAAMSRSHSAEQQAEAAAVAARSAA